jgi:hypothetical protein
MGLRNAIMNELLKKLKEKGVMNCTSPRFKAGEKVAPKFKPLVKIAA